MVLICKHITVADYFSVLLPCRRTYRHTLYVFMMQSITDVFEELEVHDFHISCFELNRFVDDKPSVRSLTWHK